MNSQIVAEDAAEVLVLPEGAAVPARISAELPAALLAGIRENQENARAGNTTRAYLSDWAAFERWCDRHDQVSLPATGATVAALQQTQSALIARIQPLQECGGPQ